MTRRPLRWGTNDSRESMEDDEYEAEGQYYVEAGGSRTQKDLLDQVAAENDQRRRQLRYRTCRFQTIVLVLAFLKIFLMSPVTKPSLLWCEEDEYKDIFTVS